MTISVHESRLRTLPVPSIGVHAAAKAVMTIGHGSLYEACVAMREKVDAFLAEEPATPLLRRVQEQVRISARVVDEALERYRPEEISISYNGGKDCLVMLIVLLACYARRYSPPKPASSVANGPTRLAPFPETLHAVYIVSTDPFAEVDAFVESSSADYHLDVARFLLPMKKGLEVFKAENPSIRAIFVGTRRTDPHGEKLKHFDPTDAGWPDFMRIHPFTRHLDIPYCSLYDQGYTSLGGRRDTVPNPRLKKQGSEHEFRPAYELIDDDEERLGRYK
ncbi:phosphoadenosine phosphosulfate reductase [Trichoderma cornu-damae]|uniref:FAD synthase n=1 Tax=Trichoderma cornu-damae TaxID=654480 RepID=A0A9P8QH02_9HYPO|nr:phosphoadenosine phosphosulfate reductase [Trichoderma cornu-damae]